MFDKIKEILANHVAVDSSLITPDAYLVNDLGLSSLDIISVIGAFEEEFDVEIADRDIRSLATVNDVMLYIEKKI
jgi:acyl carrier protein